MTPTGSAQVRQLLGECVAHCYAPYDFPRTIRRFFDQLRPRMLVLMETELWPNMLRAAAARQVPALLVNARLSERSANGYARVGALSRSMLETLDFIACQYPTHAERFLALGARPERLGVMGSVKFDVTLPFDHEARVTQLREAWQLGSRPVWIAGSTHPGEDSVVLDAHQQIQERFPDALLILVPRHPSRCEEVAGLAAARGFRYERLSAGSVSGSGHIEVVLGDTMGDLLYLYGLSRIAFLGGSLVSVGGHNPIEAAVCAQPLVMGPETFNFPDVVAAFSDAGCLHLVKDAAGLSEVVGACLADSSACGQAGLAAARVVEQNQGATDRLLDLLRAQLRAVC
jgi:3-deoxy-D-manno-octulosonic-acid transferase